MQMLIGDTPLHAPWSGPAHCEKANGGESNNPDADCYASDGSCAICDAGYVAVDPSGIVIYPGYPDTYENLDGAYSCCPPQSVRPPPAQDPAAVAQALRTSYILRRRPVHGHIGCIASTAVHTRI